MNEPVMIDGVALLNQIERFLNEELDSDPEDRNTGLEAYQSCSGAVSSAIRAAVGDERALAVFRALPRPAST